MNRPFTLCWLLLFVFLFAPFSTAGEAEYRFLLNGGRIEPRGIRLTSRDNGWAEGDVIYVNYHAVMLGKPGVWHFKTHGFSDDIVFLEREGKEIPVSVRITEQSGGKDTVVNPLEKMPAAERAELRGVEIDAPLPDIAKALNGIPLAHLALTITQDAAPAGGDKLPALPAGLTWLTIDESSSNGFKDFRGLESLKSLRGLRVDLLSDEPFDVRLLSGMKDLRYLELGGRALISANSLGKLTALQRLDVSGFEDLKSVDWCQALTALEVLNISRTGVKDISPLAALPALRSISAASSAVETLDGAPGFQSLKSLNVLAAAVSANNAEDFRKAHPQCELLNSYHATLAAAVKGATRLRIRSGGTCHRDTAEERTLFEVTVPAEISEMVGKLKFDEGAAPFHCMCCGRPSFEFYDGDKLTATIGFHHGQGMRWMSGPWPGDVHLEINSAIGLCDWLEKNGVTDAGKELREEVKRRAAAERRTTLYRNIMSGELDKALSDTDSPESAAKVFAEKLPDPLQRARVIFSLYGCSRDSWNLSAGMDEFLTETLLPGISKEDTVKLGSDANLPAAARRGLARHLVENKAWEKWDKAFLAKVLPSLAEAGLTSPRSYNRQRTIVILGLINTPEAMVLLNNVLLKAYQPEPLKPEEIDEPGGMISFQPDSIVLPDDAPDTAYAAAVLLRLKDKGSVTAVEKALAEMPADLRAKVQDAAKKKE